MKWLILSLIFSLAPFLAEAQEVYGTNSKELIELAAEFDGKIVQVTGEVIGDKLQRSGYVWLSVADEYNAISVFASDDLARKINYIGDYNHKGDIVQIQGQFFRSDPQVGGELYIRAYQIDVLDQGFVISYAVSPLKRALALFLFIFTVLLGVLVGITSRRRNKK